MLLNKLDIYSWIIIVLAIFSAAGAYTFGWQQTLPQVLIAVLAANAFDILARYAKTRQFKLTKSATVTGLFIGQLLPLSAELYLPILAAAIAIASKHMINWKGRHIFNPTLFSMLILFFIFSKSSAWWGSFAFPTQQFAALNLIVVILLGLLITLRQKRHDLVWPFIGALVLFNFVGNIFISGGVQTNLGSLGLESTTLYAAFFMLVEPKTSPLFRKARIVYGILAAAIFAAFNLLAISNFPVFAMLLGNLFVLPLDKYFR